MTSEAEGKEAPDEEYVQPSAETVILPDADGGGDEAEAEEGEEAEADEEVTEAGEGATGAEVIALDKFRNKS